MLYKLLIAMVLVLGLVYDTEAQWGGYGKEATFSPFLRPLFWLLSTPISGYGMGLPYGGMYGMYRPWRRPFGMMGYGMGMYPGMGMGMPYGGMMYGK